MREEGLARALLEGLTVPVDARLDLVAASSAVLAGGRAAMDFYGATDLDVDDPRGRGPVTAADRASNAAMLASLSQSRPGEAVRSEEAGRDTEAIRGRLWVVDPLDGTKEFIAGIDEFSVMAALAVDGEAAVGAVYRPATERLYLGGPGIGAWAVDDPAGDPVVRAMDAGDCSGGEPGPVDPSGPVRMVQSRSHPDPLLERLAVALGDVEVILSGSAGTKCALVASGEADLYVHPVPFLKEWDTCAPEAVLRGAGGRVTDCLGGPLTYGKPDPRQPRGIFAADAATWRRVREIVFDIGAGIGE